MGNAASEEGEEVGPVDEQGRYRAVGRPRDMSLPQLGKFNGVGEDENKVQAYIGINGEIFDVTRARGDIAEEYGEWFGKNKENATPEEVEKFRASYHKLGNVIEQKVVSQEELAKANGENGAPIYIAARGLVFDMSTGAGFYGPGSSYSFMAGSNAQRALARMSLSKEDVENPSLDDLTPKDIKILDDWIAKFYEKYPLIGTLESSSSSTTTTSAATPAPATTTTAPPAPAPEAPKPAETEPKQEETKPPVPPSE